MRTLAAPAASAQSDVEHRNRSSAVHPGLLRHLLAAHMAITSVMLMMEKPAPSVTSSSHVVDLNDISYAITGKREGVSVYQPSFYSGSQKTEIGNNPSAVQETLAESPSIPEKILAVAGAPLVGIQRIYMATRGIIIFVTHYRMNSEQMKHADPANIVCNTPANIACEKLSKLGLPMFIISICPKHSLQDITYSWHQFAACKVKEKEMLIIDNGKIILWMGTLEEYVESKASVEVTMKIVPFVGVTPYREPIIAGYSAQFLQHIRHMGQTTEEMPSYLSKPATSGEKIAAMSQK